MTGIAPNPQLVYNVNNYALDKNDDLERNIICLYTNNGLI